MFVEAFKETSPLTLREPVNLIWLIFHNKDMGKGTLSKFKKRNKLFISFGKNT